jgi:pyridinium-3,5-bisthiocarboxylic acid mononucleotide nickel chelatase
VFLGQDAADAADADTVVELAANIDDTTGQVLGAVVEMLLTAGALDAWTAPIAMKKSRPAVRLGVLCAPGDAERMEQLIFRQTTTIGIRRHTCSRSKLRRRHVTVETPYGPVRVKVSGAGGEDYSAVPEFDDCFGAGQAHHTPIKEVQAVALELYRRGAGKGAVK